MPVGDEIARDHTEGEYSLGANTQVAPLPAGVHPTDPSETMSPDFGTNRAAPPDTPGSRYTTGKPPWQVQNSDALPVFQRSASDWTVKIVVVNSSQNGGTAIAVGRQRGRVSVTLSVPTLLPNGTVPLGVVFAPTEDEVQAGANAGGVLNPGDSVTIYSEAQVYVGVIGAAASGAVQVKVEFNPPGGALGGGAGQ
jgi:hypothetical protein